MSSYAAQATNWIATSAAGVAANQHDCAVDRDRAEAYQAFLGEKLRNRDENPYAIPEMPTDNSIRVDDRSEEKQQSASRSPSKDKTAEWASASDDISETAIAPLKTPDEASVTGETSGTIGRRLDTVV